MAKTRAQLRTNARARADQDNSDFPTDTQYNVYLDSAGGSVWLDLIQAGWPIDFSTVTLAGTGAATIALGVGSILGVHGVYLKSGGDFLPLSRLNEGQRASLMSQQSPQAGFPGFYEVRINPTTGPVIEFLPLSAAGGSYRVDYVPVWPGFANDSDTWYGPIGSDELLEIRAARYGVLKEGRSGPEAQALDAEYARQLEQVTRTASWFDLRNPAMIRDVTSTGRRFAFDYPVGGPDYGI